MRHLAMIRGVEVVMMSYLAPPIYLLDLVISVAVAGQRFCDWATILHS